MKLVSSILLSFALFAIANASCASETTIEFASSNTELKLMGFDPKSVERFSSPGMGNKIVLKGYEVEPIVEVTDDGITVSAGAPCDGGVAVPPVDDSESGDDSSSAYVALGVASMFSKNAFALTLATLFFTTPFAAGQACSNEISIEIYTDINSLIADDFNLGECPTESFYFKHHESVFGGYEGCVAEKYLSPCSNDIRDEKTGLEFSGGECISTGLEYEDQTFWILWGDPMDKDELVKRTGTTPTVVFPLTRGPYPSYQHGLSGDETGDVLMDDAKTAKGVAKDFLVYIGAITEEEKSDWLVSMTEGAENGIQMLWAGKALEIAQTTCNRDIYVLMEAPAYGYSNGEIGSWANKHASSFYSGEECLCFAEGTCNDPILRVINVGFFPPDIPSRVGGDNVTYAADSASFSSPWFESMVFPENPSGRIKTPQLPNANRRVCDGVYVWPMYFKFNDFKVPIDDIPDCSGWSYAITKGYSASVRAGFVTYKKDAPESSTNALSSILGDFNSLGYGSYSEWSWSGQMQLQQYFMSKPIDDPTSWIGAYSSIMAEKWDVIADAFEGCPMITLTNPGAGAYAFFLMNEGFRGLSPSNSSLSAFMHDVLGVISTTYSWGFRGADPSTYYGEGVGTSDFVRMQMYRDINVYMEVARRAKLVCADPTLSFSDDTLSPEEYVQVQSAGGRRRLHEVESRAERRELLQMEVPHLHERKLDRALDNMAMRQEIDVKASACAPEYNMNCLFDTIGKRFEDY